MHDTSNPSQAVMNLTAKPANSQNAAISCANPENVIRIYDTMKQKCVLAQTFLRSRQCRSRAKHGEASAAKGCSAALPAVIIPHRPAAEQELFRKHDRFAAPSVISSAYRRKAFLKIHKIRYIFALRCGILYLYVYRSTHFGTNHRIKESESEWTLEAVTARNLAADGRVKHGGRALSFPSAH